MKEKEDPNYLGKVLLACAAIGLSLIVLQGCRDLFAPAGDVDPGTDQVVPGQP